MGLIRWFFGKSSAKKSSAEPPDASHPSVSSVTAAREQIEKDTGAVKEDIRKVRAARGPLGGLESVDEAIERFRLITAEIELAKAKRVLLEESRKLEKDYSELERQLRDEEPAPPAGG